VGEKCGGEFVGMVWTGKCVFVDVDRWMDGEERGGRREEEGGGIDKF
jgi:hypothetical protein